MGLDIMKLESEVEGDMEMFVLIRSLVRRVGSNNTHNEEQLHLKSVFTRI